MISVIIVIHSPLYMYMTMFCFSTDLEYRAMLQDVFTAVWYNGTVSLVYPAIFKSSCLFYIYFFPFDEQKCSMRFGSWTYDRAHMIFDLDTDKGTDISYYQYNTEWGLASFTYEIREDFQHECCEERMQDITFYITLRRRPIMHFYYLYFPNILINIIATFQFLLPCDSTEKVTLGITILLAMIVYLLLLEEMLPMTEVVPIIGKMFINISAASAPLHFLASHFTLPCHCSASS